MICSCHLNYWFSCPQLSSLLTPGWAGLSVKTRDCRVKTKFGSHGEPVKKCNIYRYQQPPQSHPDMAAAQVAKKLKDRRQKQTLEEIFRKVCLGFQSCRNVHNFGLFERSTETALERFPSPNILVFLRSTGLR